MDTPQTPTTEELKLALEVLLRVDYKTIQGLGYHLQHNDYYSSLNDCAFLDANRDLWRTVDDPACIDWRLDHQLEVARSCNTGLSDHGSRVGSSRLAVAGQVFFSKRRSRAMSLKDLPGRK